MCIPSSPYQPQQSSSFYISDTPPTLHPLSFTSEPIINLDELMSSAATPAVSFIPPQLAEHSSEQRIHHAHSDCGHYGSPHLNRSQSLLRNFSVRSRNTLRKRQIQGHRPLQSLSASRPGILTTESTSASTASSSSILSVWKKWVKSVTNPSTSDGQDGELVVIPTNHHAVSCLQGPARKRTQILPVGRSSTLPPSDESTCIILVSFPSI